ncbi:MAG: VTT domain-containing protein [Anaerolineae bacterium]
MTAPPPPTSAPPPAAAPVQRLLTRAQSRAILPYLLTAVALLIALVMVGEEIKSHLAAVEAWIARLGPFGVLAFVGLFVVGTSLLLPDTALCFVAGALFGARTGLAAVVVGNVLAGALQYGLARRLLRGRIERMLAARPSLAAIQRAVRRDELRVQVLLRLTPLNPATISYVLGAAGVRLGGFLTALFALTPALALEVYFGAVGSHVARLAGRGGRAAQARDALIVGGLAVGIAVVVLVSRIARRAVLEAVAEADGAGTAAVPAVGTR